MIIFPENPAINQLFSPGNDTSTWRWNGSHWELVVSYQDQIPAGPAGPPGPIGPAGPAGPPGPNWPNTIIVESVADFPAPVGNDIFLDDGYVYIIRGNINLGSYKLIISGGKSVSIIGFSENNSYLYSNDNLITIESNSEATIQNLTLESTLNAIQNINSVINVQNCKLIAINGTCAYLETCETKFFNCRFNTGGLDCIRFVSFVSETDIEKCTFVYAASPRAINILSTNAFGDIRISNCNFLSNKFAISASSSGNPLGNRKLILQFNKFAWNGNPIENWNTIAHNIVSMSNISPSGGIYDINNTKQIVLREDFIIGTQEGGEFGVLLWNNFNGTFNTQTSINTFPNRRGILQMVCTNNASTNSCLFLSRAQNVGGFLINSTNYFAFSIHTGNTTNSNCHLGFGLFEALNNWDSGSVARLCFRKNALNTNWQIECANGTSITNITTSINYNTNTWYLLEGQRNEITGAWDMYINRNYVGTLSINLPPNTIALNIGAAMRPTTNTSYNIHIDTFLARLKWNETNDPTII